MADLTIRGAGIFGLSIAWEALKRGARVRVVDPAGPAAGASGAAVSVTGAGLSTAEGRKKTTPKSSAMSSASAAMTVRGLSSFTFSAADRSA